MGAGRRTEERWELPERSINSVPTIPVGNCGTQSMTQLSAGVKCYEANEDLKV